MEARYLTDLEWRICHAVNIYVFRNGRDGEQPILVHIPPSKKKNMRSVMNVVQERVKYPVGYAKFLFKMDGTRVRDPCELQMYNNYVVASNFEKHFKCAAYGRKRSPLLVLNRESKHVRVLKLQNQNYYEWLLKKKAVGEERPPYIYPAYYTNENYRPQDLPVGQMGNFAPPEMQAPGCCYPSLDGGKTYRVDGSNKYMVNTVTVDVTPDFSDLHNIYGEKRKPRQQNGHGQNPHSKYGKIMEPTPSDMLNANVQRSEGTSAEGVSMGTSETEDRTKSTKKIRSSKHHRKLKSHRVHVVTSEEYHENQSVDVIQTSSRSSEDPRKSHKSSRKTKQRKPKKDVHHPFEFDIPPPPAQFCNAEDFSNNNMQILQPMQPQQQVGLIAQLPIADNQEILKYVDRAIHNNHPNMSVAPGQKAFYYVPEKIAEFNASGNLQPIEFTFAQPGQWAMVHQGQPQPAEVPLFAVKPQPGATTLNVPPVNNHGQPGLVGPVQPNLQMLQNMQPPPLPSRPHQMPIVPPVFQQASQPPPPCVVIPNNPNLRQHPVQPSMAATNLNMTQAPQFVAVTNPNAPMHPVYQIVHSNFQPCMDPRLMGQVGNNPALQSQYSGRRKPCHRDRSLSDFTESEVDIPFTPMKTYRVPNNLSHRSSNPLLSNRKKGSKYENPEKLPRHPSEKLSLTKVKSRNVAIQMGHPGASARTSRLPNLFDPYRVSYSDVSLVQERRDLLFNSNPGHTTQAPLHRTPRPAKCSNERFLTPSKDRILNRMRSHFGSSCYKTSTDHLDNPHSSREPVGHVAVRRIPRHSDPIRDELVTIPPPTEFRENSNANRHRSSSRFISSRSNVMYPYPYNDRSESTPQYMDSQYP